MVRSCAPPRLRTIRFRPVEAQAPVAGEVAVGEVQFAATQSLAPARSAELAVRAVHRGNTRGARPSQSSRSASRNPTHLATDWNHQYPLESNGTRSELEPLCAARQGFRGDSRDERRGVRP